MVGRSPPPSVHTHTCMGCMPLLHVYCRQSVRMRVSKRKSKEVGNMKGLASNGIRAPPTIKEESSSPTISGTRKLSLESSDPTQLSTSPTKHAKVARKLSEQPIPTQERVLVNTNLPGVRKISLDAALSGAPKIAPNGALVHQTAKVSPLSKSPVVDVDSDVDDHEYLNIDPRTKHQLKLNGLQQQIASPVTSDSEVDSSSSSWTGKKSRGGSQQVLTKDLQNQFRRWDRRQSSDSEDSISSPPTKRPPIATPRAKKPELKPKPKLVETQQVPPRPRMSQIHRARDKQTKDPTQPQPQAEKQPSMPSRPRGTEIRRARLGKQTPSPVPPSVTPSPTPPSSSTPTITATSDKGNQRIVLSSKHSAFTPISHRRTPSPNRSGLAVLKEEGAEETKSAAESRATNRPYSPREKRSPSPLPAASLAPPNTRKSRSHSESDTHDLATSPTPSPSSSPVPPLSAGIAGSTGMNPFNQQMAETIIKYILASPDTGLKNALRDCIMSDPEAVKALQK